MFWVGILSQLQERWKRLLFVIDDKFLWQIQWACLVIYAEAYYADPDLNDEVNKLSGCDILDILLVAQGVRIIILAFQVRSV